MTLQADSRAKARPHQIASLLAVAAGVLAVAGCGSSSKTTSSAESTPAAAPPATSSSASTPAPAPSASTTLSLASNPEGQLKFDTSSLTAKAGKVTINFANASPLPHNLTIAAASGTTVGETPTFTGGSHKLSVTLKAGTYKFYCSVPGHRAAGMEGTLTVQ